MKYVTYDLQKEYADSTLTFFIPNKKILGIFYNTFNVIDETKLNYRIKNAFKEIEKILFFNLKGSIINQKYPFEKVRDFLMDKQVNVFGWDVDNDESIIINSDHLGSPYDWNHAPRKKAKKLLNAQMLNEKSATFVNNHKQYASLELQSAYAGLTIPIKPEMKTDSSNALLKQSIENWIFYSTNRTINIYRLLQTPFYTSVMNTKNDVINDYHVKAKIDDPNSRISSLVLTQNQTIDFKDSNGISYELNLNGKKVNLLEKLQQEKVIPKVVFNFYKSIEGYTFKNYQKHILQGKNKIYVPYYDKNFVPTNSYATFSLGGNHGSFATNAINVPFNKEVFVNKPDNQVQNSTNAFSIDIDQCYPSMNVKLKIFENEQTHTYAELLHESLTIKNNLPKNKEQWNEEDKQKNRQRKNMKNILNTATGVADQKNKNSLLHLNNKTMSMRIMVNLIIYELGTAFVRKMNANVISTNTDGIKISFNKEVDFNEVSTIAQEFSNKYGMNFRVKKLDRILVKDTSNEIEWKNGLITNINGKLSKGYNGKIRLDGNMDHPAIVDMAAVEYLSQHDDLSINNDMTKWITQYLEKQKAKENFDGMQWALFIKPTANINYIFKDKKIEQASRFFFSNDGYSLQAFDKNGKPTKIRLWPSNIVETINFKYEIEKIADKINIQPYLQWTLNVLKQWINNESLQLNLSQINLKENQETKKTQKTKKLKTKSDNSLLSKILAERIN